MNPKTFQEIENTLAEMKSISSEMREITTRYAADKHKCAAIRADYDVYHPETLRGFFVRLSEDSGQVQHGPFKTIDDAETFSLDHAEEIWREQSVLNYFADLSNPPDPTIAVVLDSFFPNFKAPSHQRFLRREFFVEQRFTMGGFDGQSVSYTKLAVSSNVLIDSYFDWTPIAHTKYSVAEPNEKTEKAREDAKRRGYNHAPLLDAITDPTKVVLVEPYLQVGHEPVMTAIVLEKSNIEGIVNAA